jgi:hypothetical protein
LLCLSLKVPPFYAKVRLRANVSKATLVGVAGESYYFRVRATDAVSNTAEWEEIGLVTVDAMRKNYYFGSQLVAVRQGSEV